MNTDPSCEMALLVQADFDGELDAMQAASVEAHRAECAICQATYADLQNVRDHLRNSDSYARAPEALLRKITSQTSTPPVAASPIHGYGWGRNLASFGLGAAVAAAIAVFLIIPRPDNFADEIVSDHVRSLQPGHLEDVISTDQHTVKPWFDGKIDFAPPVKDLKAQGFPLQGGRLDYLAGHPVAAMVYGHGKHQINFFVWPAAGKPDAAVETTQRNGYNVIHFVQNQMNIWVVSDLDGRQLSQFVALWQAEP